MPGRRPIPDPLPRGQHGLSPRASSRTPAGRTSRSPDPTHAATTRGI